MTYLKCLGWYMVVVSLALLVSSVWQIEYGSGRADLSFLIILPFAIGLLRTRKWAMFGTAIFGMMFTSLVLLVAVIHSLFEPAGGTIGLGPVVLSAPKPGQVWILAVCAVVLIGLPMCSAILKLKKVDKIRAR